MLYIIFLFLFFFLTFWTVSKLKIVTTVAEKVANLHDWMKESHEKVDRLVKKRFKFELLKVDIAL